MRCLTLADMFMASGATCIFICRRLTGDLIATIRDKGHQVRALENESGHVIAVDKRPSKSRKPPHAAWLEADWRQDAAETAEIIVEHNPDWLIVDHYALDARWERAAVQGSSWCRVLAIDDLADRSHEADILLDQNLGHSDRDFAGWVKNDCHLLIGPSFALLRPEFRDRRHRSLERRSNRRLERILITMGGVDKDNATGKVLRELCKVDLSTVSQIDVVMGASAPGLDEVRRQAQLMTCRTEIVVNAGDMGQRMVAADLAISAAGSTVWELCCMGVPSLLVCTAANQRTVINALASAGAAEQLDYSALNATTCNNFCEKFLKLKSELPRYSCAAAQLTDGQGAWRVCETVTGRT